MAAAALVDELDRRAKRTALDGYLAGLEAELGPIASEEAAVAEQWADHVLGGPTSPRRRTA